MKSDKRVSVAEKLDNLRREYREKLPAQLADLCQDAGQLSSQYSADTVARVYQRLHKLAGSAGSFGLTQFSRKARELEVLLQSWQQQIEPPAAAQLEQVIKQIAELGAEIDAPTTTPSKVAQPLLKATNTANNLVYLVEDDQSLAAELSVALENFGYTVHHFTQLHQLEHSYRQQRPDFLIVDVSLEGDKRLGPDVVSELKQSVEGEPPPTIVITSRNDFDAHMAAVRAGAIGYFLKPLNIPEVVDCLESHLNMQHSAPYRVLIVDDDALLSRHYQLVLEGAGMLVRAITDPRQVLEVMREFHPEVVLLDLNLPGCRGYELAQLIRLHSEWLRVAIAYLSSEQDEQRQLVAIRTGGEDFLAKPISDLRLISSVTVRAARVRQLSDAIDRDSLTGLLKHSRIKEQIGVELQRAARQQKPVSVAMIDLDHFKRVNDSYGHAVGDKVIRALSQLLRQRLRRTDSVGRYGGEEFVAILPDCDASSAQVLLDDVRKKFAVLSFSAEREHFSVTLSAGVSSSLQADDENLLERADKALYDAKSNGRDQVVIAAD
ncbi:diguanylate cyclase [Gilvimarinus sp. DA14]|uniref:diguanylate cyclase n=1 Tax=Gilvimarinus sp. DA14 TaxID=2956798 RepID=UPI0020B6E552|nr:diguanylate cyclase [Gilvimarinus sp. DA14]UTF60251.1 diguanylate cyclase [Gilvimarinus sp. DA14]